MSKPFFTKVTCEEKECEDTEPKYEGFSVDLMKNIVAILNTAEGKEYSYEFIYDPSLDYGEYDAKTKKWIGCIGQLLDKVVSFITISFDIAFLLKFNLLTP